MTIIHQPEWLMVLPELMVLGASLLALMIGAFTSKQSFLYIYYFCTGILILAATYLTVHINSEISLFNGTIHITPFVNFIKCLLLWIVALVLIISQRTVFHNAIAQFEYPVLIMLSTLGMMIMVSANDFLVLFMGLELQSLSLYVLTAMRRDHIKSSEAGLKYFLLGALSTGILLYGISMIYGLCVSTQFSVIKNAFIHIEGAYPILAMIFVLCGIVFKVSLVPFHMWTPDVYEGTPTPVTALISSAPKIAAFVVLAQLLMGPLWHLQDAWQPLLIGICVISMTLGAFAALNQINIKRLLAYSSIGNLGYALIGLIAANQEGLQSAFIYLIIYIITLLGLFLCLLILSNRSYPHESFSDLKGLAHTCPGIAFSMALLLFSLAGIPPLVGFLGKFYIFKAAVGANLTWLAVYGVVTSVVGAAYYLLLIKYIWLDKPEVQTNFNHTVSQEVQTITLAALMSGLIWLVIKPTWLLHFVGGVSAYLLPS